MHVLVHADFKTLNQQVDGKHIWCCHYRRFVEMLTKIVVAMASLKKKIEMIVITWQRVIDIE